MSFTNGNQTLYSHSDLKDKFEHLFAGIAVRAPGPVGLFREEEGKHAAFYHKA